MVCVGPGWKPRRQVFWQRGSYDDDDDDDDDDLYISENNECEVDNGGCNYRCLQTPQGAICICPEGQQLNGSKICVGKLLMRNTE